MVQLLLEGGRDASPAVSVVVMVAPVDVAGGAHVMDWPSSVGYEMSRIEVPTFEPWSKHSHGCLRLQ
jgi:hypothetical protein